MTRIIATLALCALPCGAMAQTGAAADKWPPFYSTEQPQLMIGTQLMLGTLAVIEVNGQVFIDWKIAEKWAAKPGGDMTNRLLAMALIAARDGTWKPLEERP